MIHASAPAIPFRVNVLHQFHKDLYRYTRQPAGRFKGTDNAVTEKRPDGTTAIRFQPVGFADTPGAMDDLHERFARAWEAERHPRLALVAAYVLDFLVIHPYADGNGRMARLLTLLLLYHGGYEVGRYISLERLIADSKETYYEALAASTRGWHDGEHTIEPWTRYLLGIVNGAYAQFEERVGTVSGRGAKSAAIHRFIRARASDEFTLDDVRRATGGISDSYIGKTLRRLRDEGYVEALGTGRGARWRRLRDLPE